MYFKVINHLLINTKMLSYLGIVETLLTAMLFIYVKNFPDSNYLVQSFQIIGIPVNRVTSEVVFMT